ncbi:hypothetical protein NP233_g809 [Leucocoprinus birnbaumii]|uniref:Uncharacterized protein n=1 Tax=Leucocoprinus birnbaumii TaxID=56174 RepID=A0AAD5Z026_9AGAR|nr:hypothetical protein NP233_g809 [Leucocoprinus birnbaumii]
MASRFADSLRPLRPPNAPFSTISLPHALWLVIAATFAARAIPGANAYSWNLRSNPQQCQNMTIDLTGTGGQPPFRILIIPFGASPLPNNIEARKIQETVFATGNQRNGSVMLNYPANSQFVAVVSVDRLLLVNAAFSPGGWLDPPAIIVFLTGRPTIGVTRVSTRNDHPSSPCCAAVHS